MIVDYKHAAERLRTCREYLPASGVCSFAAAARLCEREALVQELLQVVIDVEKTYDDIEKAAARVRAFK